jgi:eukaryotic translation initiation factor 2C
MAFEEARVFAYELKFVEPEVPISSFRKNVLRYIYHRLCEEHLDDMGQNSIFDGDHVIYLFKELPHEVMTYDMVLEHGRRDQKVMLAFSKAITLLPDSMDATQHQVLELIFKELVMRRSDAKFKLRRSTLLDVSKEQAISGTDLKVIPGFTHTFRVTTQGVFLNIDSTQRVTMQGGPAPQWILARALSFGASFRQDEESSLTELFTDPRYKPIVRRILTELRGKEIKMPHLQKTFEDGRVKNMSRIVHRVDERMTADASRFKNHDGVEMSITEYFSQKHGKHLRGSGSWPLITVKQKFHGEQKSVNYPLDVVEICENQERELSKTDRSKVTSTGLQSIDMRMGDIIRYVKALPELQYDDGSMKLSIERDPQEIEARVMDFPAIYYARKQQPERREGQTSWNLRNVTLALAPEIPQLWIVFPSEERGMKPAVDDFRKIASQSGLRFGQIKDCPYTRDFVGDEIKNAIRFARPSAGSVALIILPDPDSTRYNNVKTYCELELSLATQCVLAQNFKKAKNFSLLGNIAAAVNVKRLPAFSEGRGDVSMFPENSNVGEFPLCSDGRNTCFIGIDIHHPPARSQRPSEACMSFSLNTHATQYFNTHRSQPRKEVIPGVGDMMKEFLSKCDDLRVKPFERFVIIRDGISSSEVETVALEEAKQIESVVTEHYRKHTDIAGPSLLYVAARKRNFARFGVIDRDQSLMSPAPGTVIDDIVTEKDSFFMFSHEALQGSPRPIYYSVIRNDEKTELRVIEETMFYLSFLHPGCQRSVSLPMPLFNAHRMGLRIGMVYRSSMEEAFETMSMTSHSSDQSEFAPINLSTEIKLTPFYL